MEEKEKRELRIAERKEAMPDNVIFTELDDIIQPNKTSRLEVAKFFCLLLGEYLFTYTNELFYYHDLSLFNLVWTTTSIY